MCEMCSVSLTHTDTFTAHCDSGHTHIRTLSESHAHTHTLHYTEYMPPALPVMAAGSVSACGGTGEERPITVKRKISVH